MKRIINQLENRIIPFLPIQECKKPIFIIGCGRSGTTILGTALSKHAKVSYLNERRDIWFSAYPITDVWTQKAKISGGKVLLDENDFDKRRKSKLSKLFKFQLIKRKKDCLIEKLPINNFRLKFIQANFPHARYIYINRNGLEVARSIEKLSKKGIWFGHNDYKWNQLVEIASKKPDTEKLPKLCLDNDYKKGLLEWRLSTEYIIDFLKALPKGDYIEISYGTLTSDPSKTINRILNFIDLPGDSSVEKFSRENISRKSLKLGSEELKEEDKVIGGDLLTLSLDQSKCLVS